MQIGEKTQKYALFEPTDKLLGKRRGYAICG